MNTKSYRTAYTVSNIYWLLRSSHPRWSYQGETHYHQIRQVNNNNPPPPHPPHTHPHTCTRAHLNRTIETTTATTTTTKQQQQQKKHKLRQQRKVKQEQKTTKTNKQNETNDKNNNKPNYVTVTSATRMYTLRCFCRVQRVDGLAALSIHPLRQCLVHPLSSQQFHPNKGSIKARVPTKQEFQPSKSFNQEKVSSVSSKQGFQLNNSSN